MARDELFLLWESAVKEGQLPVPNPTSALEGAFVIRCGFADPLLVGDERTLCVEVSLSISQFSWRLMCWLVGAHHEAHARVHQGATIISQQSVNPFVCPTLCVLDVVD